MINNLKYYLPNVAQSWLLIITLIVGGSLLSALIGYIVALFFPYLAETSLLLSYPVIFIPPALLILFSIKQASYSSLIQDYTPPSSEINSPNFGKLGVVISFVLIFFLLFSINLVTEPLTYWMGTPEFLEQLMKQIHTNKISTFLSIVLFAPLLEELFCRGIILRGLLHHTTPIKAIALSALMFGIMHLNLWQAIPAFILGAFMGWIYWRTHSLWATIFIHFVNNGFSYIVTILYPNLPSHFGFVDLIPNNYYYLTYAIALLFTLGALLLMNKNYDKIIPIKIQSHS